MSRSTFLRSRPFSAHLTARILAAVGVGSAIVPAACGGGGSLTTHSTSSANANGATTIASGSASSSGHGGAATTSGTGGAGGSTGVFGTNFDAGALGPPPPGIDCVPFDAGPCPTDPGTAVFLLDEQGCVDGGTAAGKQASEFISGPDGGGPGECCYVVDYQWCVGGGRPYTRAEAPGSPGRAPLLVTSAAGLGWLAEARPDVDALSPTERAALAAAWAADGLTEHASVASFARFALALLTAGAPADLVNDAHEAALDEVHHARLCLGLAARYGGEARVPGGFPVGDLRSMHAGSGEVLSRLATATVVEGCVAETVSALVAAEQLARATDPAVRAVLRAIVDDEARHAELAWRTVRWAVDAGAATVRDAVASAFDAALRGGASTASLDDAPHASMPSMPSLPSLPSLPSMAAHGRLDRATLRAVEAAAIAQVVAPAAHALLAAPRSACCPARPSPSLTSRAHA